MLKKHTMSFRLSPNQVKLKGMILKSLNLHLQEKSSLHSNLSPMTCEQAGFYSSVKSFEN